MQRASCTSTTSVARTPKTETSTGPHEAPPLYEQTCTMEEEGASGAPQEYDSHNGAAFPELLDLVCELLQQHETRLCINMLEALKHTESTHVINRLQGFVQEQLSTPSKGLHALAQRVQGFGGSNGGQHGEQWKSESQKHKHCMASVLDGVQADGKNDQNGKDFKDLTDLEESRGSLKSNTSKKSQKLKKKELRTNATVILAASQFAAIREAKKQFTCSRPASQASLPPDIKINRLGTADSFAVSSYLDMNSDTSGHTAVSKLHGSTRGSLDDMEPRITVTTSVPLQDELEQLVEVDNEDDYSDHTSDEDCEELDDRKGISGTIEKMRRQRCIVHPSSSGRLAMDSIGLAFVTVEGVCVPLSLGFDVELPQWWQWGATFFFAMDMITQFFTGFFRNGILIMQQTTIIKHYVTTFFWIDIVATLPWEVMLSGGDSAASLSLARVARVGKTLRLFRLLRIFRIVRMKELLMHLEEMLSAYKIGLVLNLLKAPTLFLVLCHWAACLWGFLGQPEAKTVPYVIGHDICDPGGPCEPGIEGSPWLRRYGMDNYQAATQYLVALQSSAGLLTGSGTVLEAGFWTERIYVLGMMIGSFFLCAIVLSRIVVVVDEMSKSQSELKKQLRDAKAFMHARKIPRLLQSKVTQHIEFQARACVENQASLKSFMLQLSPWLRLEITEHMNRGVILHHPFFRELPNKLVKHICSAAQIVICAPGDIVVQQGHRATNMCFLVQGRLKVRPPRDKNKNVNKKPDESATNSTTLARLAPHLLDPPCWIGDLCLFQEEVIRTNTVLSVGHAELLVLTKEALLALIEDFPSARRHYEAYRDQLSKSDERGSIFKDKVTCQYCGQAGHQGPDCPNLNTLMDAPKKHGRPQSMSVAGVLKRNLGLYGHIHKRKSHAPGARRDSDDLQDNNPGGIHVETLDSLAAVVCHNEADPVRRLCGPSVISLPHNDHGPPKKGDHASGNRYMTDHASRTGELWPNGSESEEVSHQSTVPGMPGQLTKGSDDDDDNLLH